MRMSLLPHIPRDPPDSKHLRRQRHQGTFNRLSLTEDTRSLKEEKRDTHTILMKIYQKPERWKELSYASPTPNSKRFQS